MTWVALRPISAITVRDGRSFDAGNAATASHVFPRPSTVAGAIGAALGGDFESCVGPFPCRFDETFSELLLPWPRDLLVEGTRVQRGELRRVEPGLSDLSLEAMLHGRGESPNGWIPSRFLADYLNGLPIRPRSESVATTEVRVGLWREDGRTATDAYLYSAENMVLGDDVELVADVVMPESSKLAELVRLGGEARLCSVSMPENVGPLPAVPSGGFPDGRLLLYLATPAVFPTGSMPPLPPGCRPIAAVISGPETIATMGIATAGRFARAGVRELRQGVGAGSVYFLQFSSADDAIRWANDWHGRALTFGDSDFDRLSSAGFNVVLTGVWDWPA